ncbi:hypothetical protein KIN20_022957 [Parelaphostrongylus tenuis]|uniref:Uncharacterized protein n=1 Tax=Parelaphostrongylus tenuis TaxID=148309 RepID=A0AAD5QX36_PARTN|nr:hypothetical protein KIN20_022957 [Parelaphostrongylus tenuis]
MLNEILLVRLISFAKYEPRKEKPGKKSSMGYVKLKLILRDKRTCISSTRTLRTDGCRLSASEHSPEQLEQTRGKRANQNRHACVGKALYIRDTFVLQTHQPDRYVVCNLYSQFFGGTLLIESIDDRATTPKVAKEASETTQCPSSPSLRSGICNIEKSLLIIFRTTGLDHVPRHPYSPTIARQPDYYLFRALKFSIG